MKYSEEKDIIEKYQTLSEYFFDKKLKNYEIAFLSLFFTNNIDLFLSKIELFFKKNDYSNGCLGIEYLHLLL